MSESGAMFVDIVGIAAIACVVLGFLLMLVIVIWIVKR